MAAVALGGCASHGRAVTSGTESSAAASGAGRLPTASGGGAVEPSSTSRTATGATPRLSEPVGGKTIDKPCPYASSAEFRDAEGDRTSRSVQLAGSPVGCRYYFEYDSSQIIGEIRVQRFPDATAAFNAVVRASKGHPELVEDETIGDYGSISIKLPLQGVQTWACLFSRDDLVITAHSRQQQVSQDARNIARLISSRVK